MSYYWNIVHKDFALEDAKGWLEYGSYLKAQSHYLDPSECARQLENNTSCDFPL